MAVVAARSAGQIVVVRAPHHPGGVLVGLLKGVAPLDPHLMPPLVTQTKTVPEDPPE